MMQQGLDLAVKPHIVISTPGRLADHIQSCDTFSLKKIRFLVSTPFEIIKFGLIFDLKSQVKSGQTVRSSWSLP